MVFFVSARVFATCVLLELIFLAFLDTSECLQTVVRPDKGSTVTVSTVLPLDQCTVCTISGAKDGQTFCNSSVSLEPEVEVKLLFNCSQPIEQSYTVMISRSIECTKDSCNPDMENMSSSILSEFTRNFMWEVKAPEKTTVTLELYGENLRETSQPCSDGFQYSLAPSKAKTKTKYCQGGTVNELHLVNQGVLSLQVKPKPEKLSVVFKAVAGPLKGQKMNITISPGTTIVLNRDLQESECEVCTGESSTPDCSSSTKTLSSSEKLPLEFRCLKPQDDYSVKIKKTIECKQSSCSSATAEVDPSLFGDFNRTLTWDIKVPERTVLTLGFPAGGLKDIPANENCENAFQYTLSTTKSDGTITTNSYCKGGTVSHLELLGATTVTVEVPKGVSVDQTAFSVEAAPRGSRIMSVTPDPNTIITISRVSSNEPDCEVCVKGSERKCDKKTGKMTDPRNTSVEFTCPRPQDVFSVEINRKIDCMETSCSGNIVQAETIFFPEFNRSFTWDLKVVSTRTFQLDFPEPGMRQIPNEETCPDSQTYTLVNYVRTGPVVVGTFCKGGSVTTIMGRYKGRVSLQVPGDVKRDPVDFKLNVGPVTDIMTILKIKLPRGVSDTDLITPNYPRDFPDMQQMRWDFTVPGMHNYTMHFRQHTDPECLTDDVVVQYEKENDKITKLTLSDPQPQHQQGNFNMVLKNCQTNTTLQGLSLSYRVSVMRSGHPVLCTVDLTKHEGVSLQIERVGSDPFCEMSIDSRVSEKIIVAAGTKASLSFLDCPNDDVRLTASKVIGCENVASCSTSILTVPTLDSCLPMPLHSFTWHINIPLNGTVDLVSPTGSLQQSLPGQECNQSFSLHVAETDGFSIGDFCLNGMIQKLQVHNNVFITATAQDFKKTTGPLLNVSFSQEITERIIYRVNPSMTSPTLLATPNWPLGMKPFSTVSWIVSVPSQYKAHLTFVNVSLPKCGDRHTCMSVMMLGYEEELMSRREDEQVEDKLLVPHSFYLNMSNCIPEERHFGVVTKIVLQKKSHLLAILLGLAGAVLLLIIVLAVVCVITKRKKAQMNKASSIYNGKGSMFRPGDRHFTKTRSDNDSHIYDYIDDTMVYGHLLRGNSCSDSVQDNYKGIQTDSYQTFMGPTDGATPAIKEPDTEPEMNQYKTFLDPSDSFLPPRPRTPIGRQESLGFQDRRMVDNELYTFKSTGDINTISLSGADQEQQTMIMDESL